MREINYQIQNFTKFLEIDLTYFLKGGFWISLSLTISIISGLVISYFYAKYWPPDVFGQFSFLISTVGFLSLTALPGLNQVIVQDVAKGEDGIYKASILKSLKWSLIGTILLLIFSAYFYLRSNPNLSLAFLIFAAVFPLSYGLNLFLAFLNGKKSFKLYSLFAVSSQAIPVTATALAFLYSTNFIFIIFVFAVSTGLINSILTFFTLQMIKNNKFSKKSILFAKKISFSSFIFLVTEYLDKLLIPLLIGYNSMAIYYFISLFPNQIHTFFKSFLSLAQPKIATQSNKLIKETIFKKTIQLEVLVLLIVIIYIIISPLIFKIFYSNYSNYTIYSQIFALSLLYYPVNLIGLANLNTKSTKFIYKSNIIYALSTIIPLIVLIPLFQLMGVVIARILTRIINVIFQIYVFKKLYN